MTYQDWDDENFDWNAINDCCDILYKYATKYGRLGGQIKEKYGTIRFYAHFGNFNLHTLIYPGYCYPQFPTWLWKLDNNKHIGKIYNIVNYPFVIWQKFWYNYAYQKCLKKHPHIRRAILNSADHVELIKGASRIEETATEVHTIILGNNGEQIGKWVSSK